MAGHASPLLCFFLFLMACHSNVVLCNTFISSFPEERDALLSFKNELLAGSGLSSTSHFLSWKGFNCCEWHGVQCSTRTFHVIKLHFTLKIDYYSENHPRRSLSSSLFRLKYLEHLDLGSNGFTGVVPAGLFSLTHLRHLDLSFNYFQGEIPQDIASLLSLTHLNLRFAGFNGTVPYQLENLSQLQFLDLSTESVDLLRIRNFEWTRSLLRLQHLSIGGVNLNMSGEQFGEHFSHLRGLHYLHVVDCGLSGSIPAALLNLTSLAHVFLSKNMFSSRIPSWLGNMTALNSLWLDENDLDGPFPLSLSGLPALKDLVMDENPLLSGDISKILSGEWPQLARFSMVESNVTGILPSSVGNISSLAYLDLGNNMAIEGRIPSSIGNLSALEYLIIHDTSLNGMIPASLGQLSSLSSLYLHNNLLSGRIPVELGKLPSLKEIRLGYNQLSGGIPTFEAHTLTDIQLDFNNLQGDVFLDSFENSTSLLSLSLSYNELTVHVNPQWVPNIYLNTLGLASCRIGSNLPPFLLTQDRLEYLDLSNNNLVGGIPSWFEELKDLRYLNLSYNDLEGNLPSSFNPTKYYVLDLHKNSLSGRPPIPHVKSDIVVLDLSYNRFTGMIPKKIGMLLPEIQFFACSVNDLTGGIPASIGRLQLLEVLDLSGNNLNGTIPSSITNCSALKVLNFANNSLTGYIPSDIGRLLQLESLHLSDNLLEGNLPESLHNCSELQILDVAKNLMSGIVPLWIAGFSEMMILIMRANRFEGYIPRELSNLSALHVLDIAHNRLTGSIPMELGKATGFITQMVSQDLKMRNHSFSNGSYRGYYYKEQIQVTTKDLELVYSNDILFLITAIDMSGNMLSGEIPLEIGNLIGLHSLNISRNNVVGEIPPTLGLMEQLESLDLSANKLHGKIPVELLHLSFLTVFNVSHNMLHGTIPQGSQFSTFSASSFSGNPYLCGFPLNKTCASSEATGELPAGDDEYEDGEIPWHWYVEWLVSFAVGFWGVQGVLCVKTKWRRGFYGVLDKVVVRMDKIVVRFLGC